MYSDRFSLLRSSLFALVVLGAVSPASAQISTIPLDAKATYLRTHNDPGALNAVAIDLEARNLHAGDVILIRRLGAFQYGSDPNGLLGTMGAVFSTTNELLPATEPHRIPGAIDAGVDYVTFQTLPVMGGLTTDIAQDFGVAFPPGFGFQGPLPGWVQITIPAGARYLFAAANDSHYGDNVSLGYAIEITNLSTNVDTGSGPSSVANVVIDAQIRTIQHYVNALQVNPKNHGQYVSSIAALADDLLAAGLITGAQKGELVSGAARSDIGKKK